MLSGKQRRFLRGLGHHADPVVQVGKDGLTEGIALALDRALEQHELVKVRLGDAVADERHQVAEALAESVLSELVQVLGHTVLLYRRRTHEPAIQLPR